MNFRIADTFTDSIVRLTGKNSCGNCSVIPNNWRRINRILTGW